jgi:hypothetical protein
MCVRARVDVRITGNLNILIAFLNIKAILQTLHKSNKVNAFVKQCIHERIHVA